MQQINAFALTPMNDIIASITIEDHKYLLENVENRCAIAYFAATNRNQSLFMALKKYHIEKNEVDDSESKREVEFLEQIFNNIINDTDFMAIIMYPELKSRRQFVHDCWIIAKGTDNQELKISISRDPYFFLTRDDLLVLLFTHDHKTIEHLLKLETKLLLEDDISYKLVSIKDVQVDKNQMCPLKLSDFVSAMVSSKRKDKFDLESELIFDHNYILQFMKRHGKFNVPHEMLMIFIMAGKFRLSLYFLQNTDIKFHIDFFIAAIRYNSYDVAFYLLKIFEDQVNDNHIVAIDAHIASYKMSREFLKAKLYMSKLLLQDFNFNQAKSFLQAIQYGVNDNSIEGNIFAHSSNPLLVMCTLYELLQMLMNKFLSLKKNCENNMAKVMEMAIVYICSIDDENFLNAIMLERDYEGRDSLRIAVELELLQLIQAPKVQAIIKGIYFSHYEQSGDIFQMSTPYQIVFGDKNTKADIETDFRVGQKRDL